MYCSVTSPCALPLEVKGVLNAKRPVVSLVSSSGYSYMYLARLTNVEESVINSRSFLSFPLIKVRFNVRDLQITLILVCMSVWQFLMIPVKMLNTFEALSVAGSISPESLISSIIP